MNDQQNQISLVKEILTAEDFKNEVLNSDGFVLVDFYAEWCYPCKLLAPVVEKVAEHYQNTKNIKFVKVDVDKHQELSSNYNIRSVPTLVLLGEKALGRSEEANKPKLDQKLGYMDKAALTSWLDEQLKKSN